MTQLDLPQISLQRYLELLKRRRWQVVPASLLGLLLGGIVAFFIPRYYVAETMLQHQMAPGMEAVRSKEDPFRTIVETAQITIPLAVVRAVGTALPVQVLGELLLEGATAQRQLALELRTLAGGQGNAHREPLLCIALHVRSRPSSAH